MKLANIHGDTYYVPGKTNVGVYNNYVIDPGKNDDVEWAHPNAFFGRKITAALITHGHDDHFWHASALRSQGIHIYAPKGERAMIEDLDVHTNGFFLWVKPPEGMKPWYFRAERCPLDGFVEDLDMPLEIVPLPGHTDFQSGFMTPDGVLFAGDALVAKEQWDSKGIFYFTNVNETRATLKRLLDTDADWVLPTHVAPLTGEQASELAGVNLEGLDRLERVILGCMDKDGLSTETITSKACVALKMKDEFSIHLTGETTVRAFLHALYEAKVVDYELKDHRVLWRIV
jgi:glyoxylase-like metal-dependent hydrolase (beta-lactamase superfamily II)